MKLGIILGLIRRPKKDHSQYFEGKEFTYDWFSPRIETIDAVLRKFRGNISDVLEIGSFEGRSAIFFLEYFELCKITCIDTYLLEHRRLLHLILGSQLFLTAKNCLMPTPEIMVIGLEK
jgi:hypothetical protein